jgi:hypothetical protein
VNVEGQIIMAELVEYIKMKDEVREQEQNEEMGRR